MKLIRQRRPSLKTALGITKAKRSFARATGIPTTKAGRKTKALNALTGGGYGRYQRTRAAINRPYKRVKRATGGCLITVIGALTIIALILSIALS